MEEEIVRTTRQEYMNKYMKNFNAVKIKCELCDRTFSKGSRYRHDQSKLHKTLLESIKLEPLTRSDALT